ncbi:DNA-3-methyladenine glycosylase [Legionella waltersii]|uniref:Putative 3-methyladenine DNA glycosylase n=1 Tax=Legionella waltersii TaxID=66969 RepID=A0A0W1ANC6_9GAMM|nr:DNA-3-methyladenine glycosylase [Legionella waltersii]KTD82852.1 3-methyladenine DNA glycosylase [Legionella waltersii]SNV01817.1 DNA-3-methyladenine glycosylase [Legionella waltersii]
MIKLDRSFYERDTILVAQELLGKCLIHRSDNIERIGRIVEVEAYLGQHDLACHSSKGITPRTQVMFGPAGFAYVYLVYGMHYCMNVVTEKEGSGTAVLLRAMEPVQNIHLKTQGPGLLSKAMHIDKSLNKHDLLSSDFYIAKQIDEPSFCIVKKPRIGVHYAKEWAQELLRFYIKDNPFISKP